MAKVIKEDAVSVYAIYKIVKGLVTPYVKMPAYKHGIIDKHGNFLKHSKDLRTPSERAALTMLDIFVIKVKRLIELLPFGKTKLMSVAAALYFITEKSTDEPSLEKILDYVDSVDERHLAEDGEAPAAHVAANSIAGGHLAGVNPGETPPVDLSKKRKPAMLRRKLSGAQIPKDPTAVVP